MLARVREETGLPFVTEAVDTRDVALVAEYADAIQAAAEVNAVRQTLQDQLEKFVALGDKCVLGGVVCPMDKAARGKIIKQT